MASIAMLVGGALVNAFAFSGSSYLFKSLGGDDEERKKHDEANEELQKARDDFAKKRAERLDSINEYLRRQGEAVQAARSADEAMRLYHAVTGTTLPPLGPEPKLSDYYSPSDGQTYRELLFVVVGVAATGLVAYELSRREKKRW